MFLNDGPRHVMASYPQLVERADAIQQTILENDASPVTILMRSTLKKKTDPVFWKCLHACLRIELNEHYIIKVESQIYPTDLETLEKNDITTLNP